MAWTERQHQLLRAMGLRLWSPPVAVPPEPAEAVEVSEVVEAAQAAAAVQGPAQAPGTARPAAPPREPVVARRPAPSPPAAGPAIDTGVHVPGPALAGMGWDALRETVAACRACGLCERRRQAVFGTGHPRASWLVVGEAPGEEEDRRGEPFVGASGQLLDRMLAALGLSRAADGDHPAARRVYIANAVKCRPPGNRNPEPEELKRCEPFLVRQIELLRPRLILAMGRFAVRSLLHTDEPIGRLRGRVHRSQGLPVVVTYHPSYLLRNLHEKARAWDDLCLAADTFEAIEASEAGEGQGA